MSSSPRRCAGACETDGCAPQWWGDWVTLADWRELWLNEGFATLCEWLYAEYLGQEVLAELAFGQVPVGGASELILELGNDGGNDLSLGVSLADEDFAVAGVVPSILAPGERALLPVRLAPGTAGERSAVLTLHSNDPSRPELPVALSGEGLASARIGVSPSLLDLGVVEGQGQAVLQVSNQGGAELVISTVEVDPPFTTSAPPLPASLPPGASLEVELRLEEAVSGLYRAAPRGFAQTTSVIAPLTADAIRGGYAILSSGDAGARFLAHASVVDGTNGDPAFIPAVAIRE